MRNKTANYQGRIYASVFLLVFLTGIAIRPAAAQTYRGFGAGAFVTDDNHGHKLTFQTPQPGDPGYSDWALNGSLTFKLPIPPVNGASMAFMLPGPSALGPNQIPIWDPPTSAGGTGGSQGVWRSISLASAVNSIGLVAGSGTANDLTKWTGAGAVGNSTISENAGAVTFGGYGAGVLHTDASGAITSTPVALTSDVSGTLPETNGGTGQLAYAAGDMLYASAANTLSKLSAGSPLQVLTMVGGLPSWQPLPGGGAGVTSVDGSGGTTGLTLSGGPITTSGTLTLGGTLAETNGGTGNSTYSSGDILYASSSTTLSRLSAGSNNQVLSISGGVPTWVDPSAGTGSVTSVDGSGGTTGLTLSGGPITTSGTLTLGGTLAETNGGTGNTTYASGDILYASSSTTLSRLSAGSNNQVLSISGGVPTWVDPSAGTGSVTSVDGSGGTTGLTLSGGPITTSGTLTLGGTLAEANGGTGQSAYATGDILYASSPATLARLPAGASNQVLGSSAGVPAWVTNGATITNTTNTPASLIVSANDYTIDPSSAYIRLSNISGGSLDITGINSTGVSDGRQITLVNTSTNVIVIKNQNPASATNDRFDLPGNADVILGQKGSATFIYDATLSKWEIVSTN